MSTSISDIKDELKEKVTYYRQRGTAYTDDDYLEMSVRGTKKLYIDCGWTTWDSEYTSGATPTVSVDLDLTQTEYAILSSELKFWEQALCDWFTMVGYTTNALTITYPHKPAEFIQEKIKSIKTDLVELFQKMTDDATPTYITEVTVGDFEVEYDD